MRKLIVFLCVLFVATPVFGMENQNLVPAIFTKELFGKIYTFEVGAPVYFEALGEDERSDKQLVPFSQYELSKLDSKYVERLFGTLGVRYDEAISTGEVAIEAATFNTIRSLLNAESAEKEREILQSLSDEEIIKLIRALDFLDAQQLLEKVIRYDVDKKHNQTAWSSYDGTNLYPNIVYKSLLKNALIQKLSSTQSGLQSSAHTLSGHKNWIRSVAIAHDSSFIVTGSLNKTAKIWKLDEQYNRIGEITLIGHESPIFSVAISQDNSFVVTGSDDKTAKIWKLDELDALLVPQVLLLLKYATAGHKIDIKKESETLQGIYDSLPTAIREFLENYYK